MLVVGCAINPPEAVVPGDRIVRVLCPRLDANRIDRFKHHDTGGRFPLNPTQQDSVGAWEDDAGEIR